MSIAITDEMMKQALASARQYTLLILKRAHNYGQPGTEEIIWEHGRRNFQLKAEGLLQIVCPVPHESDIAGIGIFTSSVDDTRRLVEDDPAVKADVLSFEVHPCVGFPGDRLK